MSESVEEPNPADEAKEDDLALSLVDEAREASGDRAPADLVRSLGAVRSIRMALRSLGVASLPPSLHCWGLFTLREEVGRGAFGVVYQAFDPAVEREIAVKLYAGSVLPSEPRLMARVRHPNVVTVFGAAVHAERPGIWMELIHGRTLAQRVQDEGPLPVTDVADIGAALCRAVSAVHEAQLLHQDIKARNVMQEEGGRVVLMDFGAGVTQSDETLALGRVSGTPLYMAPEVVLGQPPSQQSDVYSLGVLLYYLLAGTYPVYAPDFRELRWLHRRYQQLGIQRFVGTLRDLRPDVSLELAETVARALAPVGDRYASADGLGEALTRVRDQPPSPQRGLFRTRRERDDVRSRRSRVRVWWSLGLAAALGALAMFGLMLKPPPPTLILKRLTWDTGFTVDPALSPDGKLLAYASDRAGSENLDIWVQQMAGGRPLQLTSDAADDSQPSFSPDGSQILFRSEREGGGLYILPALGGQPRMIARGGRWPRFSPDGRWIAYMGGGGGWATVFVMPASGGEPKELRTRTPARVVAPVWSPDSRRILVLGTNPAVSFRDWDWWIVPLSVDGQPGEAIRTGAWKAFRKYPLFTLHNWPIPWQWRDDRVLFEAPLGDTTNIWDVRLSPEELTISQDPRRLTISTDAQGQPSKASDGRIVFSTRQGNSSLWELPLDTNSGERRGPAHPVTAHLAAHGLHALTPDGRRLAFIPDRVGNPSVWLRDLATGIERPLSEGSWGEFPVISRDGSRVFYYSSEDGHSTVYSIPIDGGMTDKVCTDCGLPSDLSPDGELLLLQRSISEHAVIEAMELSTGRKTEVLAHREYTVYRARLSPDGRWLLFHAAIGGSTGEFVAPFHGMVPVREDEWIALTKGPATTDAPAWSPDGGLVYYVSDRDGFLCIWGQRIDRKTGHPVGDPFAVEHSHRRRSSIGNVSVRHMSLAVAADKIIFNSGELQGNIWAQESR